MFEIYSKYMLCLFTASRRFKANHTLDSDEEVEPDSTEGRGLDDEDLAAQEDVTVVTEGGLGMKRTLVTTVSFLLPS